jgi:uncharacterized membrane protein YfcA
MLDLWLLPIFGFLIAIVASLTGIGGGIFIVPVLTLFYEFVPANAVGTSLTCIIFTAIAAALNYARQKRIYWRTGLVIAAVTMPGAYLGAWLTSQLQPRDLGLIFGFFLLAVGVYIIVDLNNLRRSKNQADTLKQKSDSELIRSGKTIAIGAGLSFFGGLASGLLGIGGGLLVVPIMTFAIGMPIHLATATSMFTMIFTSISGVVQHYQASHINFESALLLALGAVFGAQVGAYTSKRISSKNLRRVFGIVVIVSGINMLLKYWPV